MKEAVTLLDVAEAAGVSKATVSNVFNRPERVRPLLRERVEAAARSLGYGGPDPRGRMLSSGKVNAIGVLPTGAFAIASLLRNPYMREFVAGIADVCEEHGAGLSLVSGRNDQEAWGISNALVDGFIFSSREQMRHIEPALRRRLAYVIMDVEGGPDESSIQIDDRDGALQATRHLLGLGHRRFAIASTTRHNVAPILHNPTGRPRSMQGAYPTDLDRLAGIAEALAEAGLSIEDMTLVEGCGSAEETATFGVSAAALLLDNARDATAIIALTDTGAFAILDEARRRGIGVPSELSITGFDDLPAAALADPPLTTVAQPTAEKGRMAARILLEGGPPRHLVLPVELKIRASTAPPRHP